MLASFLPSWNCFAVLYVCFVLASLHTYCILFQKAVSSLRAKADLLCLCILSTQHITWHITIIIIDNNNQALNKCGLNCAQILPWISGSVMQVLWPFPLVIWSPSTYPVAFLSLSTHSSFVEDLSFWWAHWKPSSGPFHNITENKAGQMRKVGGPWGHLPSWDLTDQNLRDHQRWPGPPLSLAG